MTLIYRFSLSLIMLLGNVNAGPPASKIKYWDTDNTISWDDFKKVRSLPGNEAATIHVAISFSYEYSGKSADILIRTYMDPGKSVSIRKDETDLLLIHEKKHFDLQEVFSRKMRKQMTEYPYIISTLQKDLNKIFDDNIHECAKEQRLYDKETKHSVDTVMQKKWNEKIDSLLIEYNDFAEPKIQINIP
ncbi:MAG: hypothetical protein ABIJ16_08660 [Bacteroidota bacterium]